MFLQLNQLFLSVLNFYADFLGHSYGLAIIALTLTIRLILVPIILPSIKSQKKMQNLKPQLDELKRKYGHDKTVLSQKQMEFFKEQKINPVSGCLPQLVQIVLFIAFYQVLVHFLNDKTVVPSSLQFLWFQLSKPDPLYILPILSGITQFILGLMILPAADTAAEKTLAAQTKTKKDDKEADSMTDMATMMQSQMIFFMPLITVWIALKFPSGLALYWVASTLFSIVQQYFVSGWGGVVSYYKKLQTKLTSISR
jgi:YidC/Oxa1 family membrane protein insertase